MMDCDTVPARITLDNNTFLNVNVLLDTGALNADYMGKEVSEWLENHNFIFDKSKLTRVCAAFDDCQISSKVGMIDMIFLNPANF
jgi:hypothetical protein